MHINYGTFSPTDRPTISSNFTHNLNLILPIYKKNKTRAKKIYLPYFFKLNFSSVVPKYIRTSYILTYQHVRGRQRSYKIIAGLSNVSVDDECQQYQDVAANC